MKITKVSAAGFRGIKNEIEVSFPEGFAVITGSNGAGKSTICDIIEYAVCGTLARTNAGQESGETIAEYVWWRGKERPNRRFARVELEKEDGTAVIIERGPDGLVGTKEESIIDIFCKRDSRPTESLHYLLRTAVIRGEQISELSLDLQETERFKFVKAALGAQDHSELEEAATALSKTFKTRADRLDQDYERQRMRITDITTRISAVKAQAFAAQEILEAENYLRGYLSKPSGDLAELLRNARAGAAASRGTLDILNRQTRELSDIDRRLSEASTQEFRSQLSTLESSLRDAQTKREQRQQQGTLLEDRIKASSGGTAALADWTGLHEHASSLGLQAGKCPLCDQNLSEADFRTRLDAIKVKIDAENKYSADLLRERSQASDELRKLAAEVASLERQHKDLSTRTDILRAEKTKVLNVSASLGVDISSDSDAVSAIANRANNIREQLAAVEKQIAILESSKSMELVAELEKELTKIKEESEALLKLISKARASEERFKSASATIKRASAELVDERLAELSPLLTELYGRLKPHVDWTTVSYIMRGDVRRFLSLRIGDDLNPRFMFSNGQRRAAGLAFLLAVHLSRSWCLLNSLVLDDPVQHIDDFRALHLVEVLSAIRQTGRQVICTIEDPELAKLLCRRLRSVASAEGTLICLEYEPEKGVRVQEQKPVIPLPKDAILAA